MTDPTTVNRSLFIPTRGSDSGTWDTPMNGNFTSLDVLLGGCTGVTATSTNIILSPTQLTNGTILVTGTLTNDVGLIFPGVQGWWTVYNGCNVGTFSLFAAAGNLSVTLGIPPGEFVDIQINGNTLFYRNFDRIGSIHIWAGLSAMPRWVLISSAPPYLTCDGSTALIATYPFLARQLQVAFGGNGVSTFGLPDLRGRVALPYDGTGTRITTAGSGINGQTLGASADNQSIALTTPQIPAHTHDATVNDPGHTHSSNAAGLSFNFYGTGGAPAVNNSPAIINSATTGIAVTNANTGGGGAHPNVQPSQVTGIAVIRAA